MSEEQKPRNVRIIPDPNRHYGVRVVSEGDAVRDIEVTPTESWSEDDVKLSLITHDIRGSAAQAIRFTDPEAQELFGKLATYLLGKGLLTVQTDKAQAHADVQAFDALRDSEEGWHQRSPFSIASFFWNAGLKRGRS